MIGAEIHRPRNVDWSRAAALLYGDWGTSKAYVIGLGFVAVGFQSLPIIISVSLITALVGYNYIIICRHFPEGGGVYSAARGFSRNLAVIGALMLAANFGVTAALSGWAAMSYFGVPTAAIPWATIGLMLLVGVINWFGARHSGSVALWLAVPMFLVVVLIIALALPHLDGGVSLAWPAGGFAANWVNVVAVILALSGVEAVANLTGVMRLDPEATLAAPRVGVTARKAILVVAAEVVLATIILGWAMLSLPAALQQTPDQLKPLLEANDETMLRLLGEQYATLQFNPAVGKIVGLVVGLVVGMLLVSAVNTAVAAFIGLTYMLTKDGEMPSRAAMLNRHGVPTLTLIAAVLVPIGALVVAAFTGNTKEAFNILASLYAISVVGAITINLGVCSFNPQLSLKSHERAIMLCTFLILAGAWLTIAYDPEVSWRPRGHALFFIVVVLGGGMLARTIAQRRSGLRTVTVSSEIAQAIEPQNQKEFRLNLETGQALMVAATEVSPAVEFALEEARLRRGRLFVLYVKEVNVALPGRLVLREQPRWENDAHAARLMSTALAQGAHHEVQVLPLYVQSGDAATVILDMAATYGIDTVILGNPASRRVSNPLRPSVAAKVSELMPEGIRLLIYSA